MVRIISQKLRDRPASGHITWRNEATEYRGENKVDLTQDLTERQAVRGG